VTAIVPRALRIGQDRRRYSRLSGQVMGVIRRLEVCWSRIERQDLIGRWAMAASEMAGLHPIVFGPDPLTSENTDMSVVLRQSAELLSVAMYAERTVAESDWLPACELRAGDRFWLNGWATASQVSRVSSGIRVEYGTHREIFETGELVRTDGPDRFTAVEVAMNLGATFEEAHEWYLLSVTADHHHRAAMFAQLTDYAAARIGAAAAGVLADVGATETAVAGGGR
jgi:hypothetical protein